MLVNLSLWIILLLSRLSAWAADSYGPVPIADFAVPVVQFGRRMRRYIGKTGQPTTGVEWAI